MRFIDCRRDISPFGVAFRQTVLPQCSQLLCSLPYIRGRHMICGRYSVRLTKHFHFRSSDPAEVKYRFHFHHLIWSDSQNIEKNVTLTVVACPIKCRSKKHSPPTFRTASSEYGVNCTPGFSCLRRAQDVHDQSVTLLWKRETVTRPDLHTWWMASGRTSCSVLSGNGNCRSWNVHFQLC